MQEKRSFPRTNLKEIIKYAKSTKALAGDISLSGIRFRSNEHILPGTPMNLSIPLTDRGIVKTSGRTVWSCTVQSGLYDNGFQFVTISGQGKLLLSQYINEHIRRSRDWQVKTRLLIDVLINCCIQAKARTLNITEGGMKLFTNQPLDEQKIMLLSIPLPAGDTISMHGKAVNNRQLQINLYENNIEFWNIDSQEKQKLVAFVGIK